MSTSPPARLDQQSEGPGQAFVGHLVLDFRFKFGK